MKKEGFALYFLIFAMIHGFHGKHFRVERIVKRGSINIIRTQKKDNKNEY